MCQKGQRKNHGAEKMSPIENTPFQSTRLEEERKEDKIIFTVWLNKEEMTILTKCKEILEQPKDSTALKTLAWIGAKTIGDEKMTYIIGTIFKNKQKNKRLGIIDFD